MTTITLNELDNVQELSAERMSGVAGGNWNNPWGGLSPNLQMQLNALGAQLNRNEQILFNPNYIMGVITSTQQYYRRTFGMQMPNPFPQPRWW